MAETKLLSPERVKEITEVLPLIPELLSKDGVYPHCPRCGWEPGEEMLEYLLIHGKEARCVACAYGNLLARDKENL